MQDYIKRNKVNLKLLFFLVFVIVIALLPVSSFLFFIKNDAFNGYFPPKFFISESLQSGQLPIWNPYINFGIPQYGDMNTSYWNPMTWLIGLTTGYSAYTFTLELLLYIFIAAAGMYKVSGMFTQYRIPRLIAAISYACSGYMVHHMQHFNWVSGAAFIPWCFYAYTQMAHKKDWTSIIGCVLAFYLFLSATHPGVIISGIYFFCAYALFLFFTGAKEKALRIHAMFVVLLLLLSTGMLYGYADLFSNFTRNGNIPLSSRTSRFFPAGHWISFLFPFATMKGSSFYQLDISMRNLYIGLPVFIFALSALFLRFNRWIYFFLSTAIFFLLASLNGGIGHLFHALPLLGMVRLHGEFRIYALFVIILLGVIGMDHFIRSPGSKEKRNVNLLIYICTGVSILAIAGGLTGMIKTGNSVLYHFPARTGSMTTYLKNIIEEISVYDTFILEGILQLSFLFLLFLCINKRKWGRILWLVVADLVIHVNLVIPYAVAGQSPLSAVQAVVNKSPAGLPPPPIHPIKQNSRLSDAEEVLVGQWSMFNKEIGTTNEAMYPIQLRSSRNRFDRMEKDSSEDLYPFIYLARSTGAISLAAFTPVHYRILVNPATPDTLVIQQNYYPRWQAYSGNQKVNVLLYNGHNLGIALPPGPQEIILEFEAKDIRITMLISLVAFIILCIAWLICKFFRTNYHPAKKEGA